MVQVPESLVRFAEDRRVTLVPMTLVRMVSVALNEVIHVLSSVLDRLAATPRPMRMVRFTRMYDMFWCRPEPFRTHQAFSRTVFILA